LPSFWLAICTALSSNWRISTAIRLRVSLLCVALLACNPSSRTRCRMSLKDDSACSSWLSRFVALDALRSNCSSLDSSSRSSSALDEAIGSSDGVSMRVPLAIWRCV